MVTSAVQTWVPGLTVAQYVLVREIARGGMGEIRLARQTGAAGFDRLVVLKRVIPGGGADESAMTMFLDEARIASQLSHPNIVQVFELKQEGSSVFLVMEYLAGQTASRFAKRMIQQSGRVPAALAVAIVAAAAKALGYAHRRADLQGRPLHIVHRDVSPQNIFLTYEGEVKVLDFGIARAAGRLARTAIGVIKGKVAYMSPEQSGGGGTDVTGAADVYALGIILHELLTGTRFYGTGDDLAILRRLAISAPAPRPSSRAEVDPELEEIVLRALEPEPDQRYADGQLFFEALQLWKKRHPPPEGEPTLQQAMEELFADEVSSLGDFHREAVRTPVVGSGTSMPDRRERLATPAAKEQVGAGRTLASPLARAPGGPVAGQTVTTPLGKAPVVINSSFSSSSSVTIPAQRRPVPRRRFVALIGVGGLLALGLTLALIKLPLPGGERAEAPPQRVDPVVVIPSVVTPPPDGTSSLAADPSEASPAEPSVEDTPTPPVRPVAPVRVATGQLTLDSEPWTRVLLGKRVLGDTPLVELSLPVGQHRLRLINESEHVDTVVEITIKAKQTTVKKLAF